MTAGASEGDAEFRSYSPSAPEVKFKGDNDVGPSADRDGSKGSHWNEAKVIDESPDEVEVRPGDRKSGKNFMGTTDLTTEFSNSLNRPRSPERDNGTVSVGKKQANEPRLPATGHGNLQVMSSEGDRDEETEDDVEGASAEAPSQPNRQRSRVEWQDAPANESPEQTPPQVPAGLGGWENFLPQKNIRVLLAEDDDSTRQVVGALLRNCGYEVSSVANGMQAWETLEDPKNHFDLVLTDVVMPCLSGVGLLTKIMSDEAGRRIPVIMMSSHDSLDIVFRCLSKGAADFLVKPVRKNELKNLWQHVWRCQSLSGSGSGGNGSGSGNGKAIRAKSKVGSGKNTGSNDGSDDNSSGLNVRGGSDNGSGTQAVTHITHKLKRDRADAEEGQATSLEKLSNQQMGQDLEMATRRPAIDEMEKILEYKEREGGEAMRDDSPSTSGNKMDKGYDSGAANSGGSSAKAIDLMGGITFQNKAHVDDGGESGDGGSDRGASNSPMNDKCVTSSNSPPTLELSLKRPRCPGEDNIDGEEKRVLRHSGGSAFSRYSTSGTTIQQLPTGNPLSLAGYHIGGHYGSRTLTPGPLGPSKTGQLQFSLPNDIVGSSKGCGESNPPVHPRTSFKGNGQDKGSSMVGSSTPDGYSQQVKDEAASASGQGNPISIPLPPRGMIYEGVSTAYGAMHQVFYPHSPAPPWVSGATRVSDRGEVFDHPPYHEHGSHHPHRHSHHHQHLPHHHSRLPQPSGQSQQDEQVVTTQGPGAPRCGSSNMAGSMPDSNGGQSGSSNGYGSTGNGSGSGSNNLSNQNGQSCVTPNPSQNADGGNTSGNAGPNGAVVDDEHNRFARREAALNKFRQKRKERCFEKKVRYQSRKRLAEQRPRVRGQFVRQAVYDSNAGGEMAD